MNQYGEGFWGSPVGQAQLKVACPYCEASAGVKCRTRTGKHRYGRPAMTEHPMWLAHQDRWALATEKKLLPLETQDQP